MIFRIKCPKCGSEEESNFWIPYIDMSETSFECMHDEDGWIPLEYGRCKKCNEMLVWRKE